MSIQYIDELAHDLRRFWLKDIRYAGSGVSGASSGGGASSGDALLRDGSRSLTGNLAVNSGVTIDGIDISVFATDTTNWQIGHLAATDPHPVYVLKTRLLATGAYLLGGGNLTADRTFSADATTTGQASKLVATDAGGQVQGAYFNANSALAAYSMNDRTSGAGSGWSIYADTGSLRFWRGADKATLDTNGYMRAERFGVGIAPAYPLHIQSSTQPQSRFSYDSTHHFDTYIDNVGNVTFGQTGPLMKFTTSVRLQTTNYASQITGWGIDGLGAADFRYLFVDEMHAKSFITDLEQALAGGQIISKSVAMVADAFSAPAASGVATLLVRDLPSAPNMAVFQSGDYVLLRQFSRSAGSLTIANCWGVVTGYVDGSGVDEGKQSWTFTRSSGGNAGTMSAGTVIQPDAIVLDFGVAGNGYYEVNAIDGIYALNSPYAQIVSFSGHPQNSQTVRSRFGNLRGIFGSTEYGLYAGGGTAVTDSYIRASDLAFELRNINFNIYDGVNLAFKIDRTAPYLALGSIAPGAFMTDSGIWMGKDSGTYKLRIGTVAGGALTAGMAWDGAALRILGSAYIGNGVGFSLAPLLYCAFDSGPGGMTTNVNGHLGQRATVVGGAGAGRGKFGGALSIGQGATNLVKNPRFANAIWYLNWTAGANASSGATTDALYGTSAMLTAYSASGNRFMFTAVTRSSTGNPLSAFAWVKCLTGTASVQISIYKNDNSAWVLGGAVVVGSEWTLIRVSASAAQMSGWTTSVNIVIDNDGNPTLNKTVVTGFVQAEETSYITPPLDGAMGAGYSWAGTAHDSASTRAAQGVSFPASGNLPGAVGSVSAWVWVGDNAANRIIVQTENAPYLALSVNASNQLEAYWGGSGFNGGAVTAYAWHFVTLSCDGSTARLFMDGAQIATTTSVGAPGQNPIGVGSYQGTTQWLNGFIDDLAITNRALTIDEHLSIYNSNSPLNVTRSNYELVLAEAGSGRVTANAGGIYGTSISGKPNFTLLNSDQTVNGEAIGEGDTMLGDNSAGKANFLWDNSAGELSLRIAATKRILLDASANLKLRNSAGNDVILMDGSGGSSFEGLMKIGTGGGIIQGSGTIGTNFNGMVIYNNATKGNIEFHAGGTLYRMRLAEDGIYLRQNAADTTDIQWRDASNVGTANLVNFQEAGGRNKVNLVARNQGGGYSGYMLLNAEGGGTNRAFIEMESSTKYVGVLVGDDYRMAIENTNIVLFSSVGSYGGGSGVMCIRNRTTAPTSDPSSGGILYVESGALKYRGSGGTTTTIGPA